MAKHVFEERTLDAPYALMLIDGRGFIRFASQDVERILGADSNSLIGKGVDQIFVADVLDCFRGDDSGRAPGRRTWIQTDCVESCMPPRTVELTAERINLQGSPAILLYVREAPVKRIRDDHMLRLEAKMEESPNAVFITDEKGEIVFVNKAFEGLTGYSAGEACGQPAGLICCGLGVQDVYESLWGKIRTGQEYRGIFIHRKKSGELYHEATHVRPFINCSGTLTHLVFTGTDVSRDVEEMEHLKHLANHDPLTDLPNRALYKDRLDQAFVAANRYGTGFVVCFVDVDRLKPINDHLGHATGDLVLQTVAATLKSCIREEDTVARVGGDEFALILKGVTQRRHAEKIARSILCALHHGSPIEGLGTTPTVSIGLCLFPQDGRDEQSLLNKADSAMYRAKEQGGNAYCFVGAEPVVPRPPKPPLGHGGADMLSFCRSATSY